MPMVYWNTAGTATVELTIQRNPAEIVKITLQGCFVKKEANVRTFVERYIDRSADRNKYERSDYLFYCCVSDFREVVTRAVVYYEKPSTGWSGPTQKTKTCTVNDPFIITFGEHFFLCCDSEDLYKSRFLAENSKEVRINQALGNRNEIFGLGIDVSYLAFIPFKTQQLQNLIYKVNDGDVFNKLLETGPLLLDDKTTIVGCYTKISKENQRIEINIFGNQENPASSAISHSEDRSQVSLSPSLPGDPSTAPSPTCPAPVPSQPGHGGGPAPDFLPSGAPERDRVPDQPFPGPSRGNQPLGNSGCKELVASIGAQNLANIDCNEIAVKLAEYLQLDRLSMADPPADIQEKCRSFCQELKRYGRHDAVREIRNELPSGMTGPLLDENMLFKELDFKTKKDLTRAMCGNDLWKCVASQLQVSADHFGFFERQPNPVTAILEDESNSGLKVGELYDILVQCEAAALADNYL